jgi:hypothetical protein
MINPEKHLDEHFHDKLENLEINPPDRVWAGIANNLERAAMGKEKRRLAWLWWFSAISLVVSLATFASIFLREDTKLAESKTVESHGAQPSSDISTGASGNMNGTVNNDHSSNTSTGTGSENTVSNTSSAYTSSTNGTASPKQKVTVTNNNTTDASASTQNKQIAANNESGNKSKKEKSFIHRTPVRHVDLVKQEAETVQPEKQYKILATHKEEETAITPLMSFLTVEQRELASAFQPLDNTEIPGRTVCPKWKVGINYTYAWSTFRDLKDSKDSIGYYNGSNAYLEKYRLTAAHFDSIECRKKGFTQGIALGYRVLPHFSIKTGLDHSQYQWEAKIADAVLVKDPNGDNTFAVTTCTSTYNTDSLNGQAANDIYSITGFNPSPQSPDTVLIQHKFNYISIPLTVSYDVFRPCSKFGLSLNAGVAASFLKSYTVTHNGMEEDFDRHFMKSRSMELVAGAAVSYDPIRHLSIEIQPVYRRFIQPVNKYQTVRTYPYMWGLQGGVYFKF